MSGGASLQKDRNFIAVIGDEDSVTGLLLAGIGHVNQQQKRNFLVVDAKTPLTTIEETFTEYTKRKDIAIILINQHIAEDIRELVDGHNAAFPAVLEIPSKDHPYDPEKDSVLKRVRRLFGE
ncbi:F subunit of V-type ATPase [Mycotypha africana]|uniref:F subunit of V-type ATPase n=1 Tax=Mycotypha africana TaxID=64632 RepID=UPI0023011EDB|nr:F subunit of V-type ATPase [Mycotypha africana]KAI8966962.1 F subunit of V-type ATPase [Mycotypha africana]